MINSPYYFVPFGKVDDSFQAGEKPVFCPEHAERVSHDHPFEDGLCGVLDIELEATTPIYTRSAGDHREYRDDKAHGFNADVERLLANRPLQVRIPRGDYIRELPKFKDFVSFCKIGNKPAIPGTSLKGAIRTAMQILTNGRCEPVNNRRYSMRDLDSADYKTPFKGGVEAGFLEWRQSEAAFFLVPCTYAKVKQEELEQFATTMGKTSVKFGIRQGPQDKYAIWHPINLCQNLHVKDDFAGFHGEVNAVKKSGTLVFVGQTADRENNDKAKKREYFFYDRFNGKAVKVSDDVWQGFLDSHEDTNRKPTEAWKLWKEKLQADSNACIPVFYLAHQGKGNNQRACSLAVPDATLHSLGLSMLYRLPCKLSLHDALPEPHRPDKLRDGNTPKDDSNSAAFPSDFPSLLFGEARPDRALRGRVQFGHLVQKKSNGVLEAVVTVLGGPKPTYYPNYMQQGLTLMNPKARLRGWKFYAARPDGYSPNPGVLPGDKDGPNFDVATAFEPLNAGTVFRGKVRFHNLRPHELGALIWSLTWGGRAECRHRIGMAKPLGYGCAKIGIRGGILISNKISTDQPGVGQMAIDSESLTRYCGAFESWLAEQPGMAGWLTSRTLTTLLDLARHDHGVPKARLEYPVLDPAMDRNDFRANKFTTLDEWLKIEGRTEPPKFTFWPEWMLPQVAADLDPDAFPGDSLLVNARRWVDRPEVGAIYRCKVVKANPNTNRVRLEIEDGGQAGQGNLNLAGLDLTQVFRLLKVGRLVAAKLQAGGGNSSWNFDPIT